jgi:hypothetical protein
MSQKGLKLLLAHRRDILGPLINEDDVEPGQRQVGADRGAVGARAENCDPFAHAFQSSVRSPLPERESAEAASFADAVSPGRMTALNITIKIGGTVQKNLAPGSLDVRSLANVAPKVAFWCSPPVPGRS